MRQKWEHIQLKVSGGGPTALSDTLNKMGDEGWEPWHLESRSDHALVFFKRPRSALLAPELSLRA